MTKQKTILGLAALLGSGLALADHGHHKGHKHGKRPPANAAEAAPAAQ